MTGHDDDRYIRMRPNFPQEVEAVVIANPQVKNNQTGVRSCQVAIKFTSVTSGTHRDILLLEVTGQHDSYCFIIIDHNNVAHFFGGRRPRAFAAAGYHIEVDFLFVMSK